MMNWPKQDETISPNAKLVTSVAVKPHKTAMSFVASSFIKKYFASEYNPASDYVSYLIHLLLQMEI